MICTRSPIAGEIIGAACPTCGHTNTLHPHPTSNPALDACLACQTEDVIRLLKSGGKTISMEAVSCSSHGSPSE